MPLSDEELARELGGPVQRRPWAYASSVPMEELRVDGVPPMLLKDLSPRPRTSRPAFMVDSAREIEAYTSILQPGDAPPLVAAGADWVILERLDGVPLWQAESDAPWFAAARWAASLHRRSVPTGARHLLVHDGAHLRRWLERATAMAEPGALDAVVPAAERAIAILDAWPRSLIHGELYASNVLVASAGATADGGSLGADAGPAEDIRAIDWETCGVGPGVLDLAALVSGDWEPARRAAIVDAYGDALGADPTALAPALDAARLLVALQWLGWSDTWTPPADHAHDWLADAHELARSLA